MSAKLSTLKSGGLKGALIAGVASALIASAGPAHSLDNAMDEMFGSMSSGTVDPHTHSSQRRGHLSGGAARVRFDTAYNPQLYNVQLPDWSIGCGGIDLTGGALSWISSDQLADVLRSMAGPEVVAYAVGLAVEAMCPSCAKHMAELQDKLNQFQNMMQMSCEQKGSWLYENSGMQAGAERIHQMVGGEQAESGDQPDRAASLFNTDTSPAADGASSGDPDIQDIIEGNITWDALQDAAAGSWFLHVYSPDDLMKIMQSMIGTMIYEPPTGGSDQPEPTRLAGNLVQVREFVYETEEGTGQSRISGYSCQGDTANCMNPVADPNIATITPLYNMVYEQIDPHNDSLATRFMIHQDGIDLTSTQLAFLDEVDLPLAAMFRNAAASGQDGAHLAPVYAEFIALQMIENFMMDVINAIDEALAGHDDAAEMAERVPEVRAEIRAQIEELRVSSMNNIQSTYYFDALLR